MYEIYFGLKESPFSLTPDPRFVYFSKQHQEALSALLYGIEARRGFIQVTGEIGAGKTTLCRSLLAQLGRGVRTSLIFNPKLSEFELLQAIVEDFGIKPKAKKKKDYFDALNHFLLENVTGDFNAVVIIDEAQHLSPKALEQIRLLSNLETPTRKLLQIVFFGQPELKDILKRKDLVQLKQRITIRCHLTEINQEETHAYIFHRLRVAGSDRNFFLPEAMNQIYKLSQGVPRIINVLADRALMAAFTQNARIVDSSLVDNAHADIEGVVV